MGVVCPVHRLHGQAISTEELVWWKHHAEELKICKDCLYWITRQIEIRTGTKVPLDEKEPPGKIGDWR